MKMILKLATALLVATLITPSALWALNGAQLTGFTSVQESLGGSGVAAPVDIGTILSNPAGLTELPRLATFNITFAAPKTQMNTSAAPAGNAAGLTTSNDDLIILPGGGFNIPTPWLDERIAIGFAILPVAGFSLDYANSPIGPVANAYDTHSFYGLLKMVPAVAFKINDKLSVGLAVHVDQEQFGTNIALLSGAQTAGIGRRDSSLGIGAGVGILYKPFEKLSVGVSYTSEQWIRNFERYTDLLPQGLNFPQQATVGVSVKPIAKLLINTDFRWINWSGAGGGFGTPVASGGLGWQDQYIGMLGVQYQPWDCLTLRTGYNYGRSAIPSTTLFANALASAIAEQHIGGGVGVRLSKAVHLDVSYVRTLSKTVTDAGTTLLGAGAGAFARQSAHQASTEMTVSF